MEQVTYPIALKGYASEFPVSEQPPEYASTLSNRFINITGAAERRPGLTRITSPADNSITGKFDFFSEHLNRDGSTTLLGSRIANTGKRRDLYQFDTTWQKVSGNVWTFTQNNTLSHRPYSVQFNDKTIIASKDMRTAYYSEEKQAVFNLQPLIEQGQATSGTSSLKLKDSGVTDWLSQTFVAINDIIYNASKDAYAVITSVGTTDLDHTPISTSATGLGNASFNQASGDFYEIYDYVDNNIIDVGTLDLKDNVAITTAGTTPTVIKVQGTNFANTIIRVDDIVYNTGRNAISKVTAVSANITVTSVAGQTSGDSLVFFKSAVPIAAFPHVHYKRLYLVDSREPGKIRVSGPDDPQDYTTFRQTIDSITVNYGGEQPEGEEILSLNTFQRYLVAFGKRNVYLAEGTNPIADVSGDTTDLTPVGLFSQGAVTRKCFANIGSKMLYMAQDGAREFNINDILAVVTNNASEVLKTEFRNGIQDILGDNEVELQVIHYPRRNWVMFKVSDTIYNFNYTPTYFQGQMIPAGTWSVFTGRFAECHEYYLRSDGSLICAYYDTSADQTTLYEFDAGSFTDDTSAIPTDYQTAWLTPQSETGNGIVRDGKYIKAYFENTGQTNYTLTAKADLERQLLCDTAIVSAAGGGFVIGQAIIGQAQIGTAKKTNEAKLPLRWRGEQVQIRCQTSAGSGEDVFSKFIIYGNVYGRK